MKTAISIPDAVFQAAEGLAHRLGISRSELYAKAVAEYMKSHKTENVTELLDQVYSEENSGLEDAFAKMQNQSIPREDW